MRLIVLCSVLFLIGCEGQVTENVSDSSGVSPCSSPLSKHLNASLDWSGAVFPSGFKADMLDFTERDISYSDFSQTTGLSVKHLNKATNIVGVKLPAGFVLSGLNTQDKDISHIDFSSTFGLTIKMINDAAGFANIKLPSGFDLSGLVVNARPVYNIDFTNTIGLDPAMFSDTEVIDRVTWPAGFNAAGLTPLGYAIVNNQSYDSNLFRFGRQAYTTTHSMEDMTALPVDENTNPTSGYFNVDFTDAQNLTVGLVSIFVNSLFPAGQDVTSADFGGASLMYSDFSNLSGLTTTQLNNSYMYVGLSLPASFSLTGLDTASKNIQEVDFSNTTNFSASVINDSYFAYKSRLPASADVSEFDSIGKYSGLDYSQITDTHTCR